MQLLRREKGGPQDHPDRHHRGGKVEVLGPDGLGVLHEEPRRPVLGPAPQDPLGEEAPDQARLDHLEDVVVKDLLELGSRLEADADLEGGALAKVHQGTEALRKTWMFLRCGIRRIMIILQQGTISRLEAKLFFHGKLEDIKSV